MQKAAGYSVLQTSETAIFSAQGLTMDKLLSTASIRTRKNSVFREGSRTWKGVSTILSFHIIELLIC